MRHIPLALIGMRLLTALFIPFAGAFLPNSGPWLVVLMIFGLLTDVFDGIIARKLGVATEKLRIYDSNVDLVFWLSVIATLFTLHGSFFVNHIVIILSLAGLEMGCYIMAFIRFKKTVATHTILAKFWTLTLIAFLIDLALNQQSYVLFWICIVLGILSRIEIILIIRFLTQWTADVPSLLAVRKLNQGLPLGGLNCLTRAC